MHEPHVVVFVDDRNTRYLCLKTLPENTDVEKGIEVEPGALENKLLKRIKVQGAGASAVNHGGGARPRRAQSRRWLRDG